MIKYVVRHWKDFLLLIVVASIAAAVGFYAGYVDGSGHTHAASYEGRMRYVEKCDRILKSVTDPAVDWSPISGELGEATEKKLWALVAYTNMRARERAKIDRAAQEAKAWAEARTEAAEDKLARIQVILAEPPAKAAATHKSP